MACWTGKLYSQLLMLMWVLYEPSRCLRSTNCHLLAVPSYIKPSLPLELFVYLRLIIGILSLCTSAHLTVLPSFSPALNLTFSLLPITSSHPHASASDSTFGVWRYVSIWLTLTLTLTLLSTGSGGQRILKVSEWMTWCQTCRHGGHAGHVQDWFRYVAYRLCCCCSWPVWCRTLAPWR